MAKKRQSVVLWCAAAALAIASSSGFAGSVWNGNGPAGSSTSWNVAANWAGGAVPVQGDDVIIGTGFNSGTLITLNGPTSVRSLGIDGQTTFTLAGDSTSTLTIGAGTVNRKQGAIGAHTISANVVLSSTSTNFDIFGTGQLNVTGNISGGSIVKRESGTLSLAGANTFARLTIGGGTVLATNDAALGAAGGTLTINGGAALGLFGSNAIDRPISGNGTFTIDTAAGTTYLQGGVHGSGTLVKSGAGRMRYFGGGLNTFTGKIINQQGQLLTNAAHLNSNLNIVTNGELQFSQTSNFGSYAGSISGTGYVTLGGGQVTLAGNNTFTGGMTINDTIVHVTSDANLGAATGTVTMNNTSVLHMAADFSSNRPFVFNSGTATIQYDASVSGLYGSMTGAGTLRKTSAGELEISTIRAGGLVVNGGGIDWAYNGTSAGTGSVSLLAIDGPGAQVDLSNNHLIIDHAADDNGAAYSNVRSLIAAGRNGGAWNGSGLISSTAREDTQHITALAAVKASDYQSSSGTLAFAGLTADSSSVLVKYTYYGDTDLNGIVNFDDYSRTDAGFNTGGTDWFTGDFDYNGVVNFDDYALIDLTFNTQSGTLARGLRYLDGSDRSDAGMDAPALQMIRAHVDQFGNAYANSALNAVPEPSSVLLFGIVAGATTCGRRRRCRRRAER